MSFRSVCVPRHILFGAVLALALAVPGVQAGTIIVSADSNIINPLVPGPNFNAGNQVFFSNVLASGDSVVIRQEGGLAGYDTMADQYFDSLAGVGSSIVASLAGAALAGVDLVLVPLPDSALSAGELASLTAFVGGGGAAFFTGDNSSTANAIAANAAVNAALLALGSSIQILDGVFPPGDFQSALISADPLTSGVMSFSYAAGSRVSGGTLLFSDVNGNRLIAYETSVPEPSSLLLLSLGVALAGAIRWRQVRQPRDRTGPE
jgi:hypothetical protein